jgi:hypothetical protein
MLEILAICPDIDDCLGMREISLLNGLGTAQHPDSAHFLRPDRVYRTSVLAPMTGFRPGEAVMATARDFTIGPVSGMALSGLGQPGLFDRFRIWWHNTKARIAERAAARAGAYRSAAPAPQTATEKQVHSPGESLPPQAQGNAWGLLQHNWGGNTAPMVVTAEYAGPLTRHIPQNMVVAAYGQSPSMPTFASEAASKTTMMMWRGLRWPWH